MTCEEAVEVLVNLINLRNDMANQPIMLDGQIDICNKYKQLLADFFKEHSLKENLSLLKEQEMPKQEEVKPVEIYTEQEILNKKLKIQKLFSNNPKITWSEVYNNLFDTFASPKELEVCFHYLYELHIAASKIGLNAPLQLKNQVEDQIK